MPPKEGKKEAENPPTAAIPRRKSTRKPEAKPTPIQQRKGISATQLLSPSQLAGDLLKKNQERAFHRQAKRNVTFDDGEVEYKYAKEADTIMNAEPELNMAFAGSGGEALFRVWDGEARAAMAHHWYAHSQQGKHPQATVSDRKIAQFIVTKVWLFRHLSVANASRPGSVQRVFLENKVPDGLLTLREYNDVASLLFPAGMAETIVTDNLRKMFSSLNHCCLILDEKKEGWSGPADTIIVLTAGDKKGPVLWTVQVFARYPRALGPILIAVRHYYSREQALTGIATMEWIYEHFKEEGLFGLVFDSFYATWEALCFLEEKGIKYLASVKSSWFKSVHDLLASVIKDMNDDVVAQMTVADLATHATSLTGVYKFKFGDETFSVGEEGLSAAIDSVEQAGKVSDEVLADASEHLATLEEELLAKLALVRESQEKLLEKAKFQKSGRKQTAVATVSYPMKPVEGDGEGARAGATAGGRAGASAGAADADAEPDADAATTGDTVEPSLDLPVLRISAWWDPARQNKNGEKGGISMVSTNMFTPAVGVKRAHSSSSRENGKVSTIQTNYNAMYGRGSDDNNSLHSRIAPELDRRVMGPNTRLSDHQLEYISQTIFHYFTGKGEFCSLMKRPRGKKDDAADVVDYEANFLVFMDHTIKTGSELLGNFSDEPIRRIQDPGEPPRCPCDFCKRMTYSREDARAYNRYIVEEEAKHAARVKKALQAEANKAKKANQVEDNKKKRVERKRKADTDRQKRAKLKQQKRDAKQAQFEKDHPPCAGCGEPVAESRLWGCNNDWCGRWFGSTCCAEVETLSPAERRRLKRNHWDCPECTKLMQSIERRNVPDLRAGLRQAGLSSDGAKPTLVRRLLEATCGPALSAESAGHGDAEMPPAPAPAARGRRRR